MKEWIEKKRGEWDKIKKLFIEQYKDKDSYPVKSFLETFLVQIGAAHAKNDQESVIKLSVFDKSCGCSASVNAQRNVGYEDAIDCMLDKLKKKTESCPTPTSGEEKNCDEYTPP